MKNSWLIGMFCFAAIGVSAEVICEENFEKAPVGILTHAAKFPNSGKGVSGGWTVWVPKVAAKAEIVSLGLKGNSLALMGSLDERSEAAQVVGSLDQVIDFSQDGVWYVSFLFENMDKSAQPSDYCQVLLRQTKGNVALAGIGMSSDEKPMIVCLGETRTALKTMKKETVYRLVAKIECRASEADSISVSALQTDEETKAEPAEWDVVMKKQADGAVDTVVFCASSGNSKALFDGVRIGTTYADVTAE